MSALKLRSPISLPRRDDGTVLPAALAGLLLVGAALQLVWTGTPDLPPETVGHVEPVRLEVAMSPVAVPPVIAARPLFVPSRSGAGGTGAGASGDVSPLGGVIVSGTLSQGRAMRAFLKMPDGTVRSIGIGGDVSGWRLTALTPEAARFTRSGDSLTVPYGSTAPVIASARNGHDGNDDDE